LCVSAITKTFMVDRPLRRAMLRILRLRRLI
jgi:hypothetical protein